MNMLCKVFTYSKECWLLFLHFITEREENNLQIPNLFYFYLNIQLTEEWLTLSFFFPLLLLVLLIFSPGGLFSFPWFTICKKMCDLKDPQASSPFHLCLWKILPSGHLILGIFEANFFISNSSFRPLVFFLFILFAVYTFQNFPRFFLDTPELCFSSAKPQFNSMYSHPVYCIVHHATWEDSRHSGTLYLTV